MFIRFGMRRPFVMRDNPEGGGGGGGNPTPPTPKPETFSREYVRELREENKSTRLKLQEEAAARKAAEDKAAAAEAEANSKISAATAEAETKANQRIIKAELKALALKEGLVDLDDLALLDISGVKIKEDGSLEGAEDAFRKFKEAKPHKFGQGSSSNHTPPPKKEGNEPKKIKDMTPEERKAAAKERGIRL